MSLYEIVYVVRPDVATDQVKKIQTRLTDIIKKQDGKVAKTEDWGLRTLAYRIKKYPRAFYAMLVVDMPGAGLAELERQINLNEDIIRYMVVKIDAVEEGPSPMMRQERNDRPSA